MARDILKNVPKEPYENAFGKTVHISHVQITYYKWGNDNKYSVTVPIEKANDFANKKEILNPFVSAIFDKSEM